MTIRLLFHICKSTFSNQIDKNISMLRIDVVINTVLKNKEDLKLTNKYTFL